MSPQSCLRSVAYFLCAATGTLSAADSIDFVRDIQPIFQNHCFECHGPKKQESALRLDNREVAYEGGYHGPAVVPGDAENSVLIQVVTGSHPELKKMPRRGDPLSEEQIGLLKQWIESGAGWPASASVSIEKDLDHWAFEAPKRPEMPAPRNSQWVRNPIDGFVLSQLEEEGLNPSPEADRVTLLRRLHLDLTGLPPSIEQVDAFLADRSKDAYEKQVDRLLSSPHYGERWGRVWLDAARYADSDGFEKDKPREVWFYRDYVINALNEDKPYDQFVIEQIAGDLLPDATQEQKVATGFLRNSMVNEEGGIHPEQFRMEAMFDRMDAIGKSVLGLTVQCAQCHDHKFDPISQEEYYRMFAFINDSAEGSSVVYTSDQLQRRSEILKQISMIEADLKHRQPDWTKRMAEWEQRIREEQPEWKTIPLRNAGDNAQRYYEKEDGSLLAGGYAPTRWTSVFTNTLDDESIRAFKLELLTDPNLPANGPGRSTEGLMALTEFKVQVQDAGNLETSQWIEFERAVADFSNKEQPIPEVYQAGFKEPRVTGPVDWAIDGKEETAWGIDAGPGRRNADRTAIFIASTNVAFPEGTRITIHLRQAHGGGNSNQSQNQNLGRFRISRSAGIAEQPVAIPRKIQEILDVPAEDRTGNQKAELFSFWRTQVPEWKDANDRIAALWKQHPEGSTQLVLHQVDTMRETHFLKRGDMLKPGRTVEPGVPDILHPLPEDESPDRLTFARWLVDEQSPTTARSIVNRIWQTYFGIGLVETSEDLGTQAPAPSHPELLDWLAVELMHPSDANAEPWSLKHIHRLIVNSSTYRQSSRVNDALQQRDPYNRLLARGARFRVDAELVRDITLKTSGLLNDEVGGPSVYPPIPGFLIEPPASYGEKVWNEEQDDDRYRRALYTFRYRSVPYPVLQAFDAPNGDFSCVRRDRSNTPLQALAALNETLFMECAQSLASEVLHAKGTDDERIDYAFRRVLSRRPTDVERYELKSLLQKQQSHIAEGWVDTKTLAGDGLKELPENASPTQLAAWTTVSRVLLNLDETITRE